MASYLRKLIELIIFVDALFMAVWVRVSFRGILEPHVDPLLGTRTDAIVLLLALCLFDLSWGGLLVSHRIDKSCSADRRLDAQSIVAAIFLTSLAVVFVALRISFAFG